MRIQIKSERDFWSGLAFLVTGVGFAWGSTNYDFGTTAQPGPAYFPFGLGILLAILGGFLLLVALAFGTEDGEKIGAWAWKPALLIIGATAFFGWALPIFGMAITLPLLIVITSMGGDEFHWGEALASAAILTVGSWLLFNLALKLTIPLWPSFAGA